MCYHHDSLLFVSLSYYILGSICHLYSGDYANIARRPKFPPVCTRPVLYFATMSWSRQISMPHAPMQLNEERSILDQLNELARSARFSAAIVEPRITSARRMLSTFHGAAYQRSTATPTLFTALAT
jgi:hypothetical protein